MQIHLSILEISQNSCLLPQWCWYLVHAFISSRLNYCDALYTRNWQWHPEAPILSVEVLSGSVWWGANMITSAQSSSFSSGSSANMTELFIPYTITRQHQSTDTAIIYPRLNTRPQVVGDRLFQSTAPRWWNSPLSHVRAPQERLLVFKASLASNLLFWFVSTGILCSTLRFCSNSVIKV